jgi:hypothetical protein
VSDADKLLRALDLPPTDGSPVAPLKGLDGKPTVLSAAQLEAMPHADLLRLRESNRSDIAVQALLAPFEHRAFAREATRENPLLGVPIAIAAPVYYGAKKLGFMTDDNTAPPTLGQVGAGLMGVGEGFVAATKDAFTTPPLPAMPQPPTSTKK